MADVDPSATGLAYGWVVAALGAVGTLAAALSVAAVKFMESRSTVKLNDNDQRFKQMFEERKADDEAKAKERAELNAAFQAMRSDLQSQNIELRTTNLKLQEANTNYAITNAKLETRLAEMESHLKAADKAHEAENQLLQNRIRELEAKVRELESELQSERQRNGRRQ